MSTAAIHAIIVGIDQYPDYPPLSNSVRDTRRMSDILIKLGADKKNITLLTDSRATKDGILQELQSLPARVKRNDPIVFFFSGYAASATSDQSEEQPSSRVGVLCPYDISKNGGISDKALLQAFDLLSQSCGNNITVLLDCGGDCFGWDMPVSCVVVFPNKATEDEKGGIFTSAIISVLDGQVGQFQSITMTVEAFSKRIESIAG
ncbi:hypothetical protein BDP27DRAFT_309721 [Rhodocollybia butyracea]|uniref:Peptidase C14 caspase domain-containing protein n=1 Tax=Rhodocollybia butyracea TaxID=206335 RepID=A0A9P5PFX3_9AGAR|nr:hypothetical protein BDP27DRAFT_309721 [Rhodocollybia butyracea]